MFNPVIIGALIVQSLVARASQTASAVVGYLITTGILIWGLSVYSHGDVIAFFAIPLTKPMFIIACLIWYCFDTKEFIAAQKMTSTASDNCQSQAMAGEIEQHERSAD